MVAILWICFGLMVAAYLTGPIIDPDLWWHITAGRWILANGAVPDVDHWNMFGVGLPWRAYSWSSEIIFALFEARWGIHGLLILKFILAIGIALSLFYCLSHIAKDWTLGALLGAYAFSACYGHFTLRPQSLTWIFFIWMIFVADKIAENGLTKPRTFAITLILMLWANTHITTVLGAAVLMAWAINWSAWRRELSKIGTIGTAAVLGMLLTPYFGGELLTFSSKVSHPFTHSAIAEFQPGNLMQYATGLLVLITALLLLLVHKQPTRLEPVRLLLTLSFVLAGLAVIKFLPLAIILVAASLASLWRRVPERGDLGNLGIGLDKLCTAVSLAPKEGTTFVCIALAVVNARATWLAPISHDQIPVRAVDFIQNNSLPTPLLNDFGDGGYVMYRYALSDGTPRLLVPIDGRTNVVPDSIFKKHQQAFRGLTNWREYLDAVNPNTILWRNASPLTAILIASGEWCRVYNDGDAETGDSVFIKRDYWTQHQAILPSGNCS